MFIFISFFSDFTCMFYFLWMASKSYALDIKHWYWNFKTSRLLQDLVLSFFFCFTWHLKVRKLILNLVKCTNVVGASTRAMCVFEICLASVAVKGFANNVLWLISIDHRALLLLCLGLCIFFTVCFGLCVLHRYILCVFVFRTVRTCPGVFPVC